MGILPAIGLGISGISSLFGAKSASDRQNQLSSAAQGQMQNGPSSIEQLLSQFIGGAGTPNFNAKNLSTDPYMQALGGSNATAAGNRSNATYSGMINNGGNPYDLSSLFQALGAQQQQTQQRGVASLNANTGSFGRRYGSAGQMGVGNYLAQTDTGFNATKQQIAQQSFNDAQGRMLGAAQGLGQNANAQNGQLLQALGLGQSSAGQQGNYITNLLQMLGGNMNQRLNRNESLLGAANPQGPNPLAGGFDNIGNMLSLGPSLLGLLGGGGNNGSNVGNRGFGG